MILLLQSLASGHLTHYGIGGSYPCVPCSSPDYVCWYHSSKPADARVANLQACYESLSVLSCSGSLQLEPLQCD